MLALFEVNTSDRKHQVWERNALSVSLFSKKVFLQKLDYIHNNPVRAGLCTFPEEYKYSSASFYLMAINGGILFRIMKVNAVGEEHQQRRKIN